MSKLSLIALQQLQQRYSIRLLMLNAVNIILDKTANHASLIQIVSEGDAG
jgi:hypothetical protein